MCFNNRDSIPLGQANYVMVSGADIVYYNGVVVNQDLRDVDVMSE